MVDFFSIFVKLSEGLGYSVLIFLFTVLFSIPLGLLICFGRMSRLKPLALLFRVYISVMRGTPLMLQLFVVYFSPFYIFRIPLRNMGDHWMFLAVIIGFVLNYAAYFAEIYRSGIASMSRGQYEAAKVLGLGRRKTFFIIILPQVVRRILPSMTNEIITLVKDTSLAFAIGQVEMFTMAKRLASSSVSMQPYVVAAIIYYIFNALVAAGMARLEKRYSKYRIQ